MPGTNFSPSLPSYALRISHFVFPPQKGVIFYDSKRNDPDGLGGIPVTFTVGDGTALPGLETGIVGMKKGGIRRIIVPPELGYNPKAGPYLEPIPVNAMDVRALDSVVQNPRRDATLLFDVKLERIK